MWTRWRRRAEVLGGFLAVAAVLFSTGLPSAAASPAGAMHTQAAGCQLPLTTVEIAGVKLPWIDFGKFPGYVFCVVTDFFTSAIQTIFSAVVSGIVAIFAAVGGALLAAADAVVAFFAGLVNVFALAFQGLGVVAPIASAIAVVILLLIAVLVAWLVVVLLKNAEELA